MFAYIVRRSFAGVHHADRDEPGDLHPLLRRLRSIPSATRAARTARRRSIEQTKKALGYDKPLIVQWTDFLKGIVAGRDVPRRPGAAQGRARAGRRLPRPVPGLLGRATRHDRQLADQGHASRSRISLALAGLPHLDHRRRALRRDRRAHARARSSTAGSSASRWSSTPSRRSSSASSCSSSSRSSGRSSRFPSTSPIADGGVGGLAAGPAAAGAHAGAVLHGRLRPDDPRVRARVDGRGLHPHRAGQGPRRRGGCSVKHTHARRADAAGHAWPASTSPACWAARSSPRRSSTTTASASSPSTPTRPTTCRRSSASCCCSAAFVIIANIIVDVLYAVIDPRVRVG